MSGGDSGGIQHPIFSLIGDTNHHTCDVQMKGQISFDIDGYLNGSIRHVRQEVWSMTTQGWSGQHKIQVQYNQHFNFLVTGSPLRGEQQIICYTIQRPERVTIWW